MTPSADYPNVPVSRCGLGNWDNKKVDWLVSVRSENELLQAIRYGVDIVDFKEPSDGALAPVDPRIWETAAANMRNLRGDSEASATKLSAALGESDQATEIASAVPARFGFAKAGPQGCGSRDALRKLWTVVGQRLDPSVELVAVAYADHDGASCIDPESVFEQAKASGLDRCLIDTYGKQGASSLQQLGIPRLSQLSQQANQLGLWWALAGSITLDEIGVLFNSQITPNCFAVRGDVCDRDRTGSLSNDRMQLWQQTMQTLVRPNPARSSL